MSYEQRMEAAIVWLDTQEKANYSTAARKFNLRRTAVASI